MAQKYETAQQFMESLLRQVGGGMRRPTGDQAYQGGKHAGLDSAYDDFDDGASEEMGHDRFDPHAHAAAGRPINPVDAEIEEPLPALGGYSSDVGRHSAPQQSTGSGEIEPRVALRKVKSEIKELERKLHELQGQKVDLMRKITGRL